MRALVIYESMFGNTEKIARAIAAGLAESLDVDVIDVVDVARATAPPADVTMIVAGGPTHAFSMTRTRTRADALKQGASQGSRQIGLRDWLDRLPQAGQPHQRLATFDTRASKVRHLPGSAAKSAARAARKHGYEMAASPESFYVHDVDGPLLDGELERATTWGRQLAAVVPAG
jgi:hypothetical protein